MSNEIETILPDTDQDRDELSEDTMSDSSTPALGADSASFTEITTEMTSDHEAHSDEINLPDKTENPDDTNRETVTESVPAPYVFCTDSTSMAELTTVLATDRGEHFGDMELLTTVEELLSRDSNYTKYEPLITFHPVQNATAGNADPQTERGEDHGNE